MFGAYRTFLALLFVFLHLGGVDAIGGYAAFGFYALSGYLLTLIMHERHDCAVPGPGRWVLQRLTGGADNREPHYFR